ncbi:MAG TPA: HNH endonuclease [Chloroflexota bacterium]|nr:HNH endonuclease [Chloroflexota bacterium]
MGIAFFANVPKPVAERFWAKVNKGGPTIRPELGPCWLWTAGTTKAGYGVIGSGGRTGKMTMAHRLSWEMHNGPIPAGLHVCHKCDNPPCVNPDHLFTGTVKRNSEDMVAKGRSQRGTTHWRAQLSEDDVRAIRTRYGSGEGQRALASEYGIHWMTVFRVIHRKLWAHVA